MLLAWADWLAQLDSPAVLSAPHGCGGTVYCHTGTAPIEGLGCQSSLLSSPLFLLLPPSSFLFFCSSLVFVYQQTVIRKSLEVWAGVCDGLGEGDGTPHQVTEECWEGQWGSGCRDAVGLEHPSLGEQACSCVLVI